MSITSGLQHLTHKTIEDALHVLYPMVSYRTFHNSERLTWEIDGSIESPQGERWTRKTSIGEDAINRATNVTTLFIHQVTAMTEELINSVPTEKIGAYPFARIWYDQKKQGRTYLWAPGMDLPGWVFSKAYQTYPRDKSVKKETVESIANEENFNEMKEALKVANTTTKKKRVVKRAPLPPAFDASKVRAPLCVKHETPMTFDMMEEKWRCTTDGCKVVSRPKRDEDDRNVIMGKGGLQLRLVCQDGERNVVLISDDNIALDITKMVNLDELLNDFGVMEQAALAEKTGKEIFTIPIEQAVAFSMPLVVMGASDLL